MHSIVAELIKNMKTPTQFARHYLYFVLGDRKGMDIRDLQDKQLESEIIEELATLIKERDGEVIQETLNQV